MMSGPRKKAPKTIAVIDPDRCFGAFACSICQAACPVAGCIVEEKDRDGRMVCAVRADLCIGCGLCVTLGNPDRAAGSRVRLPAGLRRHQHDAVRAGRQGSRGVGEGRNDDFGRCRLGESRPSATACIQHSSNPHRQSQTVLGTQAQTSLWFVPAAVKGMIGESCFGDRVTLAESCSKPGASPASRRGGRSSRCTRPTT